MTVVLGIDTATSGCAAALVRDGETLAVRRERMARGQSEALAPMIDDVVRKAGISFNDIDAVAVTRGPGAFTGLRIGLAAARALALALGKPCLGIGTFAALHDAVKRDAGYAAADACVIAVDSKRDELFVAIYDTDGRPQGDPAALRPEDIPERLGEAANVVVAGDGAARIVPVLAPRLHVVHAAEAELPDPVVVARLGIAALAAPETAPATPLYLRPPDVTLPRK
ncbi:MAG: tRNA (adenosine(37)-N6)-threonylcarbamoyltransferase complex dimerization subunit type 1 TsaB [Rhodospirillales bacterium]